MKHRNLVAEYAERTKHFDLCDWTESVLEQDYARDPLIYTDAVFEQIQALHLFCSCRKEDGSWLVDAIRSYAGCSSPDLTRTC